MTQVKRFVNAVQVIGESTLQLIADCYGEEIVTAYPKKRIDSDIPCSGVKVCAGPTCQSGGEPQSVLAFAVRGGSTDELRSHCRACESCHKKQYYRRVRNFIDVEF